MYKIYCVHKNVGSGYNKIVIITQRVNKEVEGVREVCMHMQTKER